MLSFKQGVSIAKLSPQMVLAIVSIHAIFQDRGYELIITSVSDGIHKADSRHYSGNAADLRIWNMPTESLPGLISFISRCLGSNFDVLLENDHIHVEYDPK